MKNDDVMDLIVVFCILVVFILVLYCFCVATEFSVNKDLYSYLCTFNSLRPYKGARYESSWRSLLMCPIGGRWKRKYWKMQVRKRQVRNSAFRKDGKRMYGKCKYNANLQSDKKCLVLHKLVWYIFKWGGKVDYRLFSWDNVNNQK